MASSDRYFPATILGGRLHVRGIPDWGPWNPSRLEWEPEEYVEIMIETMRARKLRTLKELEAIMKEPRGPAPTSGLLPGPDHQEPSTLGSAPTSGRRAHRTGVIRLQLGILEIEPQLPNRRQEAPRPRGGCMAMLVIALVWWLMSGWAFSPDSRVGRRAVRQFL